jgi:small subunit ribosomal protein S8
MNKQAVKFLISIKNGSLSKKTFTCFEYNVFLVNICVLLYKEGLIQSFKIQEKILIVFFRYSYEKSVLKNLTILSTPSNTRYLNSVQMNRLTNKRKLFFVSTNRGLLTNVECKKQNCGGILLFSC